MYKEISKGIDGNGLERFLRFTGKIVISLEDTDPSNVYNFIEVLYMEYWKTPNGDIIDLRERSYIERNNRAIRWFTQVIPGTQTTIGNDVVIPSINEYLTENLQ